MEWEDKNTPCPICDNLYQQMIEYSTRAVRYRNLVRRVTSDGRILDMGDVIESQPVSRKTCGNCFLYDEGWISKEQRFILRIGLSVTYAQNRITLDPTQKEYLIRETCILYYHNEWTRGFMLGIAKNPDYVEPKQMLLDYLYENPKLKVPRTLFLLENAWKRTMDLSSEVR